MEASWWCMTCLELLCTDCHRVHVRSKASRGHVIVTVDELQNESTESLMSRSGSPPLCVPHGKPVTHVCVDCRQAACQTCLHVSHAKCKRIEQMDKVSPNLRADLKEARQRVDACRQGAEQAGHVTGDQLAALTQSKDTAMLEVEATKERLLECIQMKAEKTVNQIEAAYAKHRAILTSQKHAAEITNVALGKTGQFLDVLRVFGDDVDVLRNFDVIVKNVTLLENQQSAMKSNRGNSTLLKLVSDKKALDFIKNPSGLGEAKIEKGNSKKTTPSDLVEVNPAPVTPKKAMPPRQQQKAPSKKTSGAQAITKPTGGPKATGPAITSTPKGGLRGGPGSSRDGPRSKLVTTFTGRCATDTMKTDLRALTVLTDESIVLLDTQFRNKRLKKFNNRGKLISQLDPGECPADMTLLPGDDLVVSLPKAKELAYVSAGGTLHVTGRIKTNRTYQALSSSQDGVIAAMATASPDPPTVDIISFNGELLQSVQLDKIRFPFTPKDLVLTPCGQIYILFGGTESLVCVTHTGEVTMSYRVNSTHGVKRLVSVTCDDLDNAYIADRVASKVHLVGSDGSYKGHILGPEDGLREPVAVCRTDEGCLAVTQTNGDVKVYQLP